MGTRLPGRGVNDSIAPVSPRLFPDSIFHKPPWLLPSITASDMGLFRLPSI